MAPLNTMRRANQTQTSGTPRGSRLSMEDLESIQANLAYSSFDITPIWRTLSQPPEEEQPNESGDLIRIQRPGNAPEGYSFSPLSITPTKEQFEDWLDQCDMFNDKQKEEAFKNMVTDPDHDYIYRHQDLYDYIFRRAKETYDRVISTTTQLEGKDGTLKERLEGATDEQILDSLAENESQFLFAEYLKAGKEIPPMLSVTVNNNVPGTLIEIGEYKDLLRDSFLKVDTEYGTYKFGILELNFPLQIFDKRLKSYRDLMTKKLILKIGSHYNESFKRAKKNLEQEEKQLTYHTKVIEDTQTKINELKRVIKEFKPITSEILKQKLDEARTHKKIQDIFYTTDGHLVIITENLIWQGKKHEEMGRYLIHIRNGSIYGYNMDYLPQGSRDHMNISMGSFCWGDQEGIAIDLFNKMEFYLLCDFITEFLTITQPGGNPFITKTQYFTGREKGERTDLPTYNKLEL